MWLFCQNMDVLTFAHLYADGSSLVQLKDTHAKAMSSSAASAESKLAAAMAEKDIVDAQVSHICQGSAAGYAHAPQSYVQLHCHSSLCSTTQSCTTAVSLSSESRLLQ